MIEQKIRTFLDTQEGSTSVVVKSLIDDRQFSIDPERVFPSASTIKLFIMSELFRQAKERQLSLSDTILLNDVSKTGGDGILKELDSNHDFTLKELCTLMIIISDNTATNLLIEHLGMNRVNQQISQMGLKSASLQRKMMDLEAVRAGRNNYISGADFAAILESIYRGENVDQDSSAQMLDI